MSDQAVLLPKWSPQKRIILAKGQLDHSYTFWTMANYTTVDCLCFLDSDVIFILHWFKCTNYIMYDIENISKNTTENTIYPLYLCTVIKCPKGTGSCIFCNQYICSVQQRRWRVWKYGGRGEALIEGYLMLCPSIEISKGTKSKIL